MSRVAGCIAVATALVLTGARHATAQSLGTFTWQLQPFCNRVTVQVTQSGGVYTLDGYDDQCGAPQRAPLVGLAAPNPDGSIGLGFHIATSPGGKTVSVESRISLASIGGPWTDSAGNTGTLVLNGAAAGSARPAPATGAAPGSVTAVSLAPGAVGSAAIADGTVGAADVDSSQVQLRLSGACPTGQFMVGSALSGTVTCSDGAASGSNTSTALGTNALANGASGARSTAIGANALSVNGSGIGNTAIGIDALRNNTTASSNVAVGDQAMTDNISGGAHVAVGSRALWRNVDGIRSVALGNGALQNNVSGNYNVAVGASALLTNSNSDHSVAVGESALYNSFNGNNTAVGYRALYATTGSNNTALGYLAGSAVGIGLNNVHIANSGLIGDFGVMRLGTAGSQTTTYVSGVRGVTVPTGIPVIVGSDGQLGTTTSSRRFKQDIADMGDFSARLAALRPVTFRYTQPAADGTRPLDMGLIAEEVAEVFPELAVRGHDGEIETVAYHKLPALLLNELQKQQRLIEALLQRVSVLEATRDRQ